MITTSILSSKKGKLIECIFDRIVRGSLTKVRASDWVQMQINANGRNFSIIFVSDEGQVAQIDKGFDNQINSFLKKWNVVVNSNEIGFDHRFATFSNEQLGFESRDEPNCNQQGVIKVRRVTAASSSCKINLSLDDKVFNKNEKKFKGRTAFGITLSQDEMREIGVAAGEYVLYDLKMFNRQEKDYQLFFKRIDGQFVEKRLSNASSITTRRAGQNNTGKQTATITAFLRLANECPKL